MSESTQLENLEVLAVIYLPLASASCTGLVPMNYISHSEFATRIRKLASSFYCDHIVKDLIVFVSLFLLTQITRRNDANGITGGGDGGFPQAAPSIVVLANAIGLVLPSTI